MIRLRVAASARMRMQAHSDEYTTTPDDLPGPDEQWTFFDIPRAGDDIEDPDTGRHHKVVRVVWWTTGDKPSLVIE